MTDYPAALAAAREAENERSAKVCELLTCDEADTRRLSGEVSVLDRHCAHRLRDLLAALDVQVPVAWRMFDGEGGYDFRDELPSENSRAWSARYGRKWEPLFAAPPAALAVPAGYVPVSALIEARDHVEDWAAYASPYFQDKHDLAGVLAEIDGQIAAATQAPPAAAVSEPIAELLKQYEREGCGFSDVAWVKQAAMRYVKTMPDSQVRCLLYVLAQAPTVAVPVAAPPAAAVAAENVTPMRQPRADLARLVESIKAAVYANGDGLSVTEAIGALELAKLELLKEQEQ